MGDAFTVLQLDDEDVDDPLYLADAEKRSTPRDEPAEIDRYIKLYNLLPEKTAATGTFEEHASRILKTVYATG